ncbi:hypothetical protein BT69DRAFT_1282156, partial [Atractiella rhizophila]
MKFTLSILLAASAALASPVKFIKRAGPSGVLQTPTDSTVIQDIDGVEVQYSRVNGDQGFYTEYIDIDLIDKSVPDGQTYRVATGITSKDKDTPISTFFNIPSPADVPTNLQVQWQIVITEYQDGQDGRISFKAAAPTFTTRVTGGDQCAGRPNGDCGN